MPWDALPEKNKLEKTLSALKSNGFEVINVPNASDALSQIESLVPESSEVMEETSVTLSQIGFGDWVKTSNRIALRDKLRTIENASERLAARRKLCVVPFAIGSVQAVTSEGQLVLASGSGSQLPPYAYTAEKVIFVVGAQKIVDSLDAALKRIQEHCLPLEGERMKAAGFGGTRWNKTLILSKEPIDKRTTIIIVNEKLGF